jgi:hypothetical protein
VEIKGEGKGNSNSDSSKAKSKRDGDRVSDRRAWARIARWS